ncbi:MAG: glycerophosphodiester phosphodiesterase family protein [Bacilli bacterium]|nr:glycerophosphodiester phosphodiesterase [Erysipelotrichia bacterium]
MEKLKNFLTIALTHRGLHNDLIDENSLSAFKASVEHGYGIELDVHLLKDGTLIVFHDNDLKRLTGDERRVDELTKEDLKTIKLLKTKEPIPTLFEVLKIVDGKVPVLIELKADSSFDPKLPEAVIKALEDYPKTNNIAIESFNPFAVKWLRKNYPNKYPYGQLISHHLKNISKFSSWLFKTMHINLISKPDFIAFDINCLPNKKVKRLFRKNVPLISWTVNSKEKLELAKEYTHNWIFEDIIP